MNKRFDYVDALKGFAILLVVFGHAIQINSTNFDENIFFKIIYSFHMPLFMFLSGMVASYSFDVPVFSFLKKKFSALVVPFVSWYALAYFANGSYHTISLLEYVNRVLLSPDWGLWFLWVLFLNFCFLVLTIKMEKGLGILSFLITVLLVEWAPFNFLGFGLAKIHFVYFSLGYLIMRHKGSLKRYLMITQLLALLIFPLLISEWHRTKGFAFAEQTDKIFSPLNMIFLPQLLIYGCAVLLALSGITLAFMFVRYVIENSIFYKYFCKLGNYTLDIYVSHQYFLFGVGIGSVKIFSSAFTAFITSLMLSVLILRRVEILNRLFLGGRTKSSRSNEVKIISEPLTT